MSDRNPNPTWVVLCADAQERTSKQFESAPSVSVADISRNDQNHKGRRKVVWQDWECLPLSNSKNRTNKCHALAESFLRMWLLFTYDCRKEKPVNAGNIATHLNRQECAIWITRLCTCYWQFKSDTIDISIQTVKQSRKEPNKCLS